MRRQVKKAYTTVRRSCEKIRTKLDGIQQMATDEFNLLVGPDLVIENAQWLESEVEKIALQLDGMRAALKQLKADMEEQEARDSAKYDDPAPSPADMHEPEKRDKALRSPPSNTDLSTQESP